MKTNNPSPRTATSLHLVECWHSRSDLPDISPTHIATGFPSLDRMLLGGGWPVTALTEIFHPQPGLSELRLLLPALIRLSRLGRWIAVIAQPFAPYAPALAELGLDLSRVLLVHPKSQQEGLAAVEQGLRSGACGAVIAWPKQVEQTALHRLQAAAEAGRSWGILFRLPDCQPRPSPAALQLQLETVGGGATQVRVQHNQVSTVAAGTLTLDFGRPPQPGAKPSAPFAPPPAWQRLPQQRSGPRRRYGPTPRQQPESPQLDLPLA